MTDTTRADLALAAFLGFAMGDALGATVEFMTRDEIAVEYGTLKDIVGGGWLHLKPGRVTDDTDMALAVGRSLVRAGKLDLVDMSEEFVTWLRSGPIDVGHTCRRGIRRYINNGTVAGPFNEGDAGNGAAMRVLPIALANLDNPQRGDDWAVAQGHVTHHHPLSDGACIALVDMVRLLITTPDRVAARAAARARADALVEQYPRFVFTPYRGLSTAYVVDTIQTAFHGFFSTDSLESCIVTTVNLGGDADTTGAIAGMLAGALYGPEQLPQRWLDTLDPDITATIRAMVPELLAL